MVAYIIFTKLLKYKFIFHCNSIIKILNPFTLVHFGEYITLILVK